MFTSGAHCEIFTLEIINPEKFYANMYNNKPEFWMGYHFFSIPISILVRLKTD